MARILRLCTCLALLLAASPALAEERILSFTSDIKVNLDGSLDVSETITVNALGQDIKHGIYRDLPDSYPHPRYGDYGLMSRTPIRVRSLKRNGVKEPWRTETLRNGIRIFFGSPDRRLS